MSEDKSTASFWSEMHR